MSAQTQEIRAGLASVEKFTMAGISIVTSNEKAAEDINTLWERFFQEKIGQKITAKTDDVIYAVYSDYEGDHEKPFRLTIGYRLNETLNDNRAPEFHEIAVQAGDYAILSAAGEQPKALIETWEAIWSSDLNRSFQTDFEIYGPRFFEDGVNEVLVHVGVKI